MKGEKETGDGNSEWRNEDLKTESIKDTEDTSEYASYSQKEEDEEGYDGGYSNDYYNEDDDDGESTTEANVDAEEDKKSQNADVNRIDTSRKNGGIHNEGQNPEMNEVRGDNNEQGEMQAEGGDHGRLQAQGDTDEGSEDRARRAEGRPEDRAPVWVQPVGIMAGAGDAEAREDDKPPRGSYPNSDLTFNGFYSMNETVGGKPVVKVSWCLHY